MKTSLSKAALLVALSASGCASSPWEKTEAVPGGRLYVPKLYAPLLPGSIYPDKKVTVPAKGRPVMVLVCPPKGGCHEREILDQAAQRGLVVLIARAPGAALGPRAEADAARTGTLIVATASLKVEIQPPPQAGATPFSLSKKNLLATLLPGEPLEATDGTVLKLYSPNEKGLLPNEAFRDAVEWLAGELGAR